MQLDRILYHSSIPSSLVADVVVDAGFYSQGSNAKGEIQATIFAGGVRCHNAWKQ
jgi:hypothetical protein